MSKIIVDNEILIYNLNQIVESLKKAEKLVEFFKKCNFANTTIYRWQKGQRNPTEEHIKIVCEKLGISINDIYFKKLNIEFNQKINIKFGEEIEDAVYYNINEIVKCLAKHKKHTKFEKDLNMGNDTIISWQRKKRVPRRNTMKKICNYLGISIDDIFFKKIYINITNELKVNFENNKED